MKNEEFGMKKEALERKNEALERKKNPFHPKWSRNSSFFILHSSLILLLLLASCSRSSILSGEDDDNNNPPPLDIEVATRSTQGVDGEELQTQFAEGTTLGIVCSGKHYAYTYTTGGKLTAVNNWIVFDHGETSLTVDAFYPHRGDGTYTTLYVEQDQSTTTNGQSHYYLSDALHATGTATRTATRTNNALRLKFYHTMSKLVFNVAPHPTATLASLTVADQPLSARFSYSADGSVSSVSNISTTLQPLTASGSSDKKTFRAIIIPQNSKALTVTATTSDGNSYKATLPARSFEAGKQYTYTLKLIDDLKITPTGITSWTDGGNEQEITSIQTLPGKGTETDPYQVASMGDFKKIANFMRAHYKQTAHIDMNNESFDGIAGGFRGVYDGNGQEIRNVNISGNAWDSGLFNVNHGTLKNIKVVSGSVASKQAYGGVICGRNYGSIEGCTNAAEVTAKNHNVGGICGSNEGTIDRCTNSGTITTSGSWNSIGGICGSMWAGTISNCTNTGTVSGAGADHGGIVGANRGGTVINCTPPDQNTQ